MADFFKDFVHETWLQSTLTLLLTAGHASLLSFSCIQNRKLISVFLVM